jgi:hypothetical protein
MPSDSGGCGGVSRGRVVAVVAVPVAAAVVLVAALVLQCLLGLTNGLWLSASGTDKPATSNANAPTRPLKAAFPAGLGSPPLPSGSG